MQYDFELGDELITQDKYRIQIIGQIQLDNNNIDENLLIDTLHSILREYLKNTYMIDALDLIQSEDPVDLQALLEDRLNSPVSSIQITTIDAVEKPKDVNVEIDPELESQKQKQGFLKNLKSKFFGS